MSNETDRGLLELAAKAAGLSNPRYHEGTSSPYDSGTCILHDIHVGRETHSWNPLTDDGDALRLLTILIQSLLFDHIEFMGEVSKMIAMRRPDEDAGAILRWAIVRAAAEIGKQRS